MKSIKPKIVKKNVEIKKEDPFEVLFESNTPSDGLVVWVYVICYNEITIAPFMIDYWKTYASRVIIYDNGSTDGCLELFRKYDWIEIRTFDTNGLDDLAHIRIKNNCWKECRRKGVDFVQVSDFDEIPYCENMIDVLMAHKLNNDAILNLKVFDVISTDVLPHNNDTLYHKIEGVRFVERKKTNQFEKAILFDPKKVKEIRYEPGCHRAFPSLFSNEVAVETCSKIKLLHFTLLGIQFLLKKFENRRMRNVDNVKHGFGVHYYMSIENTRNYYNESLENSKGYYEIDW